MKILSRSGLTGTLASLAIAGIAASAPSVAFGQAALNVNGVDIDPAIVDFYIESRIQKPAAQATAEEQSMVVQELTDIYLLTTQPKAATLKKDPRVAAQIELQSRSALAQAVVQDFLAANPASDEEIAKEYETQMAMAPKEQFRARHILVPTQGVAQDLVTQLDGGADFQELAKEHSTGPTGPNGGDLGWFAPGQMVKPFSDAVATLEDGAYTATPVQTQFGWHVILREESRENVPPPIESVRDAIKQRVEQAKFQGYVEKLRADHANSD